MLVKLIGETTIISNRAVNTDHDFSGPNLPVTIVQQPEDSGDRIWVLDAIQYSYNKVSGEVTLAAPITGRLTVKVGDKVKWDADVPDLTGVLNLYIPSQTDKVISVTLGPGGNGVVGKLNVQWHLEPAQ